MSNKNWMVKNLEKYGITPITPNGFMAVIDWMNDHSNIECPEHFHETYIDHTNECIRCSCCGAILKDEDR